MALACARPAATPLPEGALRALVVDAEAARGLTLPGRVDVRNVLPEEVAGVLTEELDLALDPSRVRAHARLARALGLLPTGVDLRRALVDFQSDAAIGFYSPLRRRLYLVAGVASGGRLREDTEGILVHELVHALQDHHSRLLDVLLGLDGHDDLSFALGALLEGDATWAQFRHQERRSGATPPSPADMIADWSPAWAEAEHPGTPRLLRESFLLQYPTGYRLVVRLLEAGGLAALDAALHDPPLSSQELLHPERYLEPRRRRPIALFEGEPLLAAPGCQAGASNVFGELGLRVFARERGASQAEAEALAASWDGDRAWLLRCTDGDRLAWLVQHDDAAAAAQLARRLAPLAAPLRADLRVDAAGRRTLLSAGIPAETRRALLESLVPRRVADLDAYLALHPEVLERARRLRRAAN